MSDTQLVEYKGNIAPTVIEVVKRTICKEASAEELYLFLAYCDRAGLDPRAKQIILIPQWDSKANRNILQPYTTIDGFRAIAARTGQYRGRTCPEWCGPDGQWRGVWLEDTPPSACKVGVHREGFAEPLYEIAHYQECVKYDRQNKVNRNWATQPALMLAIRAESRALRAAFPQDLSGHYSPEEMGTETIEAPEVITLASKEQLATLHTLLEARSDRHILEKRALNKAMVKAFAEMTAERIAKCIEYLRANPYVVESPPALPTLPEDPGTKPTIVAVGQFDAELAKAKLHKTGDLIATLESEFGAQWVTSPWPDVRDYVHQYRDELVTKHDTL